MRTDGRRKEGNAREGRGSLRGAGRNRKARGVSNPEISKVIMWTAGTMLYTLSAPWHSCQWRRHATWAGIIPPQPEASYDGRAYILSDICFLPAWWKHNVSPSVA